MLVHGPLEEKVPKTETGSSRKNIAQHDGQTSSFLSSGVWQVMLKALTLTSGHCTKWRAEKGPDPKLKISHTSMHQPISCLKQNFPPYPIKSSISVHQYAASL